jgi:hypothetical protein
MDFLYFPVWSCLILQRAAARGAASGAGWFRPAHLPLGQARRFPWTEPDLPFRTWSALV